VTRRTALVTKGEVEDFRPFSLAVSTDGASLWLVDWAFNGWRAAGPRTGRLYRLRYSGAGPARPAPRPSGRDPAIRLRALDHPALAVRLESQRLLAGLGPAAIPVLADRLTSGGPEAGRLHALWALDAIGGPEVRRIIGSVLSDSAAQVRLQAIRSVGIRHDRTALPDLVRLLRDRDAAVRREAAIAIGKLGDVRAGPALFAALDEADRFAAWSVRGAIRRLDAWEKDALVAALLDDRRRESALALSEEAWAVAVVEALTESLLRTGSPAIRARLVANLAGQYRRYPEWSGSWFGPNPLAGRVPEKTRDWSPQGMEQVRRGLALGLADRDSSVRAQAIAGLGQQGRAAAPWLRAALVKEPDPRNQAALAETLGRIGDAASAPILALLLTDANRPEVVRAGALEGLSSFRDRQSLRARLTVIYDPNAPARLVARALSGLAGAGLLPPNDLASFLENPAPAIRAAALLSLNVKQALPAEVQQVVLDRLDDPAWEVREAAILAVDAFRLRAAVPRLVAHAGDPNAPDRASAIAALCRLPDPRGRSIYEAASRDRNPHLRQAAESALRAIGDRGPAAPAATGRSTAAAVEALRQFAMRHDGDPRRGEEIFFDPKGVGCGRCHCASGQGTATIGPDLTGLASKYNRAELIRSVLEPSSRIAPGYQPAIVALRGGKVVTGVVRAETKEMLELADAEAKVVRIPKRDIEVRRSGAVSIMPEHLADSLTPIEFTDLISFLASLKPTARPTAAPAQP
ncbi:MAG TPA: HEAT repeat domain-containing protein, partial [Isosphaeraceae bacterium]|nr:HEAT repeat domain-containing protein [Isosphaeraceae bacterium]